LALFFAAQHNSPVSSISSKEIDLTRSRSGFFFARAACGAAPQQIPTRNFHCPAPAAAPPVGVAWCEMPVSPGAGERGAGRDPVRETGCRAV
jgi:hypothetical protein